jgi:hypothetical protein
MWALPHRKRSSVRFRLNTTWPTDSFVRWKGWEGRRVVVIWCLPGFGAVGRARACEEAQPPPNPALRVSGTCQVVNQGFVFAFCLEQYWYSVQVSRCRGGVGSVLSIRTFGTIEPPPATDQKLREEKPTASSRDLPGKMLGTRSHFTPISTSLLRIGFDIAQ